LDAGSGKAVAEGLSDPTANFEEFAGGLCRAQGKLRAAYDPRKKKTAAADRDICKWAALVVMAADSGRVWARGGAGGGGALTFRERWPGLAEWCAGLLPLLPAVMRGSAGCNSSNRLTTGQANTIRSCDIDLGCAEWAGAARAGTYVNAGRRATLTSELPELFTGW
jgi:hypothetical protein